LGVRRKQRYADYFQAGNDLSFPDHVDTYLNAHAGVSSTQVERQLTISQALIGGQNNGGLDPDRLYLTRVVGGRKQQLSGYRCPRCNSFFLQDRKSTRLNSSHVAISYAVFCLKKKKHSSAQPSSRLSAFTAGAVSTFPTSC